MDQYNAIIFVLCVLGIFILGKLFLLPIKKILKLIFNSLLGAGLIYLINQIGTVFNFHIGLNIATSIFIGILGIPGAILLIILKVIM